MPFYEYQCKNCGHTLEAMQKVNDAPLKKCPHCGKSQLTRLMSAPVFRLKGGGWYETDFKGDSDNKKNLADRPPAKSKLPTAGPGKARRPRRSRLKSRPQSLLQKRRLGRRSRWPNVRSPSVQAAH
jgi:putative FmdB family regulatory protein